MEATHLGSDTCIVSLSFLSKRECLASCRKKLYGLGEFARCDSVPSQSILSSMKPSLAVDVSGKGDHYTNSGADGFFVFEHKITELDDQLRKLCNAARQLGSSVGILSASTRLRERLGRILYLFRENAADLFPQKVAREEMQVSVDRLLNSKKQRNLLSHLAHFDPRKLDSKHLVLELQLFSRDISTLLECFSQFPEFVDEIPDRALGKDLNYWAMSLNDLEDEFKTHAVQRFLHDSMADIGERLDRMATKFIPVFIDIGIPTIRASQKHSAANLNNLSTVATLFSGVTATMLQFSYQSVGTPLANSVNVFWFTSLVFSISAAVNSLLGLTWTQAIFRSPDHRIPWWVRIWIKRSPLAFLVLSVACFFIGMVLFAFSSNQAKVTTTVTTVLSATCCFGLLILSAWFAFELVVYNKHEGRMWLADVLTNARLEFMNSEFVLWSLNLPREVWYRGRDLLTPPDTQDIELQSSNPIGFRHRQRTSIRSPTERPTVSFWLSYDKELMTTKEIVRHRWHEATKRTIEDLREAARYNYGKVATRKQSQSSRFAHLSSVVPTLRATDVIPKLEKMAITQQLHIDDTHDALVRFLQFSPDGKSLVTSSWDRKSFILHVGDSKFLHERTLAHPPGPGFMNQLEWSPEGDKLLMRRSRCVTVWNRVGECICNHQQSPTDHPVRSVAWLTNEEFLFVEGSKVVVMDTKGEELRHYRVDNLLLRDIVITSDKTWMVCVGTHDDDKSPRKKNQIILYNLVARRIIKRSLVYHEICDITLACDGRSALVSYENKAPSQLWELVLQRNNQDLVLRHTYMPKVPTTFAGLPSIFGGSHDQLILRASTAGDIYVWDRDSATLLHQIHVPTRLGHLTSFAWNRAASDSWMFVTGSHEGAVYIWTTPTDEVPGLSFPLPLVSTPDSMSRSSRPWGLSRAGTTSTYGFGDHTESPLGHGTFADRNRRTRSTFTEDSEVTMGDNDSPMRSGFRRAETFS